jgi:hypothetical protein
LCENVPFKTLAPRTPFGIDFSGILDQYIFCWVYLVVYISQWFYHRKLYYPEFLCRLKNIFSHELNNYQ